MTEEEKNTVRRLREQGYGYKTISNITGIHRETIKSHLKRHPCEVGSTPPRPSQCQIKKKIGTKKPETPQGEALIACKQCGEPVMPQRKGTLFCCDECRHKWWGKISTRKAEPCIHSNASTAGRYFRHTWLRTGSTAATTAILRHGLVRNRPKKRITNHSL